MSDRTDASSNFFIEKGLADFGSSEGFEANQAKTLSQIDCKNQAFVAQVAKFGEVLQGGAADFSQNRNYFPLINFIKKKMSPQFL
ncbi:MAG: hypothetical protein GC192_07215 [Bacteroidetes bacterium]|nr:hypothetical protein [Bacteroidota bacterium]